MNEEEEEVEEKAAISREVWIPVDSITLPGELSVPDRAEGLVLFAHGSGSSRHSPRNQYVAQVIREAGVGTLLLDLLTREEERIDPQTRHLRFDNERRALEEQRRRENQLLKSRQEERRKVEPAPARKEGGRKPTPERKPAPGRKR